jgi:integral membrane protein (TIGR01906 family)
LADAGRGAALLFVVALPLFLLTTNLRIAFSGAWLYTYGFDRFNISISKFPDITEPELRRVAEEVAAYWSSDAESLDVRVQGRPLYSQREVIHLRDVKGLVQGVFRVQEAAGALLLTYVTVGLVRRRGRFWDVALARRIRAGAVLTLGLLAVSGIALGAAFPWLFHLFHLISFRNDFWQLGPQDALIQMFPDEFWFMATMLVVAMTVQEAALLTAGAWLALRRWGRLPV